MVHLIRYIYTPLEALSYGIINEVIQHKFMIPTPKIPSLKVGVICHVIELDMK
jgi:hypothetical protein